MSGAMHIDIWKSQARCARHAAHACMRKTTIACAVALLSAIVIPASAEDFRWGGPVQTTRPGVEAPQPHTTTMMRPISAPTRSAAEPARAHAEVSPVLRESQVTDLRAALNLTAGQQQYWVPVEAALHALVRQQARDAASGVFQRLSDRSSALAVTAMQLRRLKAVAMPLINILDESQRREAIKFARHMGYGQLVASF